MLVHGVEGFLYPSDEPYMISYYVCSFSRTITWLGAFPKQPTYMRLRHMTVKTILQTIIEHL